MGSPLDLSQAEAAIAAARAAPLSAKRAMRAALTLDAAADAHAAGGDVLAVRAALAARSEALRLLFALCAMRADGPRLVTEAVTVPLGDYGKLGVEDFMVSLYNGHTVQRVLIAEGTARRDVHAVLAEALEALAAASDLDQIRAGGGR